MILATAGVTDMTTALFLLNAYKKKTGTIVQGNLGFLGKLKREVEKAKRVLQYTKFAIENFEDGKGVGVVKRDLG